MVESVQGAITTFTKGLATHLIERGIRVNAIAPGPIWTPLIQQSYPQEKVQVPHFFASCVSQTPNVLPLCNSCQSTAGLGHPDGIGGCCLVPHKPFHHKHT